MTIDIYRSALCEQPAERIEFAGTIAEFIALQPNNECMHIAAFREGVEVPVHDWATTPANGTHLRPVPHGFGPITWVAIAAAALAGVSLLMQPGTPGTKSTPQGKSLATAEATANSAKPNAVVPELAGRYLRYPDYLTPPRRYFADPRTQYMETMLCIGPGLYDIERVKIGNTDFASLDGTEYHIYQPGANVAADGLHGNWYSAKEVGSTSAGTAGLELSSDTTTAALPASPSYVFGGTSITSENGWPSSWGTGTQVKVTLALGYSAETVGLEGNDISEITGPFSHIQPLSLASDLYAVIGGDTVQLRANTISPASGGNYKISFLQVGETIGNWLIAPGNHTITFYSDVVAYTVVSVEDNRATFTSIAGWFGFPDVTLPAASTTWAITNSILYGDWAGPFFAMPTGEQATQIEYDLFFPQGLCEIKSSGELLPRSVLVEVQYRAEGAAAWVSATKTYSNNTLDQIGFTERVSQPAGRYEFRHRRTSAASTSTQVNDKVQLYGLHSLLRSPESYEGWTVIGVRIKGLGKIASSSENQINVLATRMLPTLSSPTPVATRDISAFVKYIAGSVGYNDLQIDNEALQALHNLWTARGDTLDHVYDLTTVRAALGTALRAGMGEMTLSDGLITPIREGVRPQHGKVYSKQNVTSDIRRAFKTPRHDDNDGVQVEFVSSADNYTTQTIDCMLPGSLGIKLEKLKLEGVTDRIRAWRVGMRRVRELAYQRWTYEFSTEMDAFVSNYRDRVEIVPDIPEYGRSCLAMGARRTAQGIEIAISEQLPEVFTVAAWRDTKGNFVGPFTATRINSNTLLAVAGADVRLPNTSLRLEPSHVYIGTLANITFPALIDRMAPSDKKASVQAVNYDPRKYADDDNFPS